MTVSETQKPHELLEGLQLGGGWTVIKKVSADACSTGGHFSCGYIVQHDDGRRGYLKALDFFSGLSESEDPARQLQPLIDAFNFERDLLDRCKQKRMSRVVTALTHGAVKAPGNGTPIPVQYIIFELAECDIRAHMGIVTQYSDAWALRVLHHTSTGLEQLHSIEVAHQDLKPSNVLQFEDKKSSKVADLGRAFWRGKEPPHYKFDIAGDRGYAPPELLWGNGIDLTWEQRSFGCDVYHLGSLISSLFTTIGLTPLLTQVVDPSLRWNRWRGDYQDALVFLRPAFEDTIAYVAAEIPQECRSELVAVLRWLSDPDPVLRGHPKDRASRGSSFSLRRFTSIFNRLATRAEWALGSP